MKSDKETLEKKNLFADAKKKNAEAEQQKALAIQQKQEAKRMEAQIDINKVEELRLLLNAHVVDETKTCIGTEPIMTYTINGKNRDIVIKKLMEVVGRF